VREVILDYQEREATVVVPDDQLSLAIGKDGQNARLANRLTGWKIDIKSETEMSVEDSIYSAAEAEPEVVDGRCHALTVGGKRCPNAALPGNLFCGIPSHQALVGERKEANK
jgi:N utilization substance protein A